jgi:hypothetical protein
MLRKAFDCFQCTGVAPRAAAPHERGGVEL